MSLVKTILGLVIGAGVGVAVLVAVSLIVPQFQGSKTEDTVAVTTKAEPAAQEVVEIKEPEPAAVPDSPVVVEEVAPEVAAEPEIEETAEPVLPKIVMQSEQTDADKADKKIKLPTIEASEPVDEPSVVVEEPEPDVDTGITIGKKPKSSLPSITEESPDTTDEAVVDHASAGKALEFNATEFTATDKPMFGVILLDIGDKGLSIATLKKLNAPITIAILSDDPDASTRALAFNAAGFEVMAMVSDDRNDPLGTALNTGQVNDALDLMFNTVPNAIGLLDSAQAKIQKNSRISKAVVKNFINSGHGLITYTKGLNSVDREARVAGVRTAKVARKLDANRENKAIMVRYLDRASLDAGRDGAVIVLGTTAKQTVATIAAGCWAPRGKALCWPL